MQIKVKVITHASRDAIESLDSARDLRKPKIRSYKVWVRAIPEKGKANDAVIKILSLEFGVPKTLIRLVSGPTSSQKQFEIDGLA